MSRAPRSVVLFALAVLQVTFVTPLAAQDTSRTRVVPFDTQHVHKTLFTWRDAALAGGFVGLTVAMFPVDQHINTRLQDPTTQTNRFFNRSAKGVEIIASPGAFIIGGGMYAIGRWGGHPWLEDLGWHGTESVLVASLVTGVLKGSLGRSRPYVSADTNPHDFKLFGGFSNSDRQSFPSGHTTAAFAAAAAVTSEMRRMHPEAVWYVAPVMYGGATLVGLSRMYHNKHWASDVVLGAAIGTFSGLKVVRYSHTHPDNRIDRVMLHTSLAVMPNGQVGLVLTAPAPTGSGGP
ncbi:MAG TPA: phosphatase PAP2 family protein [Gemmatimonadaceae bacterium]|nr:phosphatase PAP2 family protein [Gemmatimonadaceae bacterium]